MRSLLTFIAFLTITTWTLSRAHADDIALWRGQAQKALAKGDLKEWEYALGKAERAFNERKAKMALVERYNHQMWLLLLRLKYHQFKGALPPIKNVDDFESKSKLGEYIKEISSSLKHLQQSKQYLKQYNDLYTQVAQQSDITNLVYLKTSLPLQIALEQRDGKIYRSLLQYAYEHWKDQASVRTHFQKKTRFLKAFANKRNKLNAEIQQRKSQQKSIATQLQSAQKSYNKIYSQRQRKEDLSIRLFWTGVGLSGLGIVGGILGVPMLLDNDYNATPSQRQKTYDRGLVLTTVSGIFLAFGITGLVIGTVLKPSLRDKAHDIIKAQNQYLDTERKNHPTPKSSLPHPHKRHTILTSTW